MEASRDEESAPDIPVSEDRQSRVWGTIKAIAADAKNAAKEKVSNTWEDIKSNETVHTAYLKIKHPMMDAEEAERLYQIEQLEAQKYAENMKKEAVEDKIYAVELKNMFKKMAAFTPEETKLFSERDLEMRKYAFLKQLGYSFIKERNGIIPRTIRSVKEQFTPVLAKATAYQEAVVDAVENYEDTKENLIDDAYDLADTVQKRVQGLPSVISETATKMADRIEDAAKTADMRVQNLLRSTFLPKFAKFSRPTAVDIIRDTDLTGQVALVTGGREGIGREVAIALAIAGAKVVITSRNPEEASKAIAQIRAETGLDNIHCMKLDLGEAASIEEFSSRWKAHGLPLHILVNNAGTLRPQTYYYKRSHAGLIEKTIGVNYVGHALLTELLLPHFSKDWNVPTRVVNVTSGAHRWATLHPEEVHYKGLDSFTGYQAYAVSKLGNIIHANLLAKKFEESGTPYTANSVNPGIMIDTKLYDRTFFQYYGAKLLRKFNISKTAQQAAAEIVYVATDPKLKKTNGKYFENFKESVPDSQALDPKFTEPFMEETDWLVRASAFRYKFIRLDHAQTKLKERFTDQVFYGELPLPTPYEATILKTDAERRVALSEDKRDRFENQRADARVVSQYVSEQRQQLRHDPIRDLWQRLFSVKPAYQYSNWHVKEKQLNEVWAEIKRHEEQQQQQQQQQQKANK